MKTLFVAHEVPFKDERAVDEDWAVLVVREYDGLSAVYPVGEWQSSRDYEVLAKAAGMIAVFDRPSADLTERTRFAHEHNIPVVAFLPNSMSAETALGEGVEDTEWVTTPEEFLAGQHNPKR